MNDTPMLPGFRVPSAEEERNRGLKKAFHLILTQYGGDVNAFVHSHFAPTTPEAEPQEICWEVIQSELLKRQSPLAR